MRLSFPASTVFLIVTACGSTAVVAIDEEERDGGFVDAAVDAPSRAIPSEGDAGRRDADAGPSTVCGAAATQVPLESVEAVKDYLGINRWGWEGCGVTDLCPASDPLLVFVNERYEEEDYLFMLCGRFCDESDGGVCVADRTAHHTVQFVDAGADRYELRTGFDDIGYSFLLTAWNAEGPAIELDGQLRGGGMFRKASAPPE